MPLVPSACNTSKCVPQYMAPLLGICILASGAVYWIFWAKVLPKLRGYKIVPTRIARENGAEIVEFRKIWTAGNLNGNDTTAGTS